MTFGQAFSATGFFVGSGLSLKAIYHMIRMAVAIRDDAPDRWIVNLSPFWIMYYPDDLTERGLWHRRRFLTLLPIGFALGIVACWLQR